MCGIVGAVAQRNVTPILLEGLKHLEYRGYDSAGIAVLQANAEQIKRIRTQGKVNLLQQALKSNPLTGTTGIAHTRWATHGQPSEKNAHPHATHDMIAIVHNGIIENHNELRKQLTTKGYKFYSDTDTEVISHCIHELRQQHDLLKAVQDTTKKLHGAYALGVIDATEPNRLIAVRCGSPLVIGLGIEESFIASDQMALLPVTERFIHLQEGDIADIRTNQITIYDKNGKQVERPINTAQNNVQRISRGAYRHFMLKEIFEQPEVVRDTLSERIINDHIVDRAFGNAVPELLDKTKRVQIIACGTSYHAGYVAKYWLEEFAGVACRVEIASEHRYRSTVVEPDTLFITISQSGETADTLAALKKAKKMGYLGTLAVCNVPESSLVRESDAVMMTRAGVEIGVASTKAFTTQLTVLLLLTIALGQRNGLDKKREADLVKQLNSLPQLLTDTLKLDGQIKHLAKRFADKQHALFLGRGYEYPIAMEGALKLKEISYIHAEAYPAGELKHGPLALVDGEMPVIAVAPKDDLLEKLKSNLNEVSARGGELIIFADSAANIEPADNITIIEMPTVDNAIAPIVYTIPLQLLAYHVAVIKGTDIDQPRNLAKSVTVE